MATASNDKYEMRAYIKTTFKQYLFASVFVVVLAFTSTVSPAQTAPKMKTGIPPDITTPDSVQTRLGTLKFFDGLPDKATVEKVYDNLDFMRGVDVFREGKGTV